MKSMAEDQIDRIEKDNAKSDYDLVLGKGRSMAYFSTPEKANDKRKSITCMHKKKHDCTTNMVAMRKLKAGRILRCGVQKVQDKMLAKVQVWCKGCRRRRCTRFKTRSPPASNVRIGVLVRKERTYLIIV